MPKMLKPLAAAIAAAIHPLTPLLVEEQVADPDLINSKKLLSKSRGHLAL